MLYPILNWCLNVEMAETGQLLLTKNVVSLGNFERDSWLNWNFSS